MDNSAENNKIMLLGAGLAAVGLIYLLSRESLCSKSYNENSLQNIDIFSPFYTGKFVHYGLNDTEMLNAMNNKERTPAFYRYHAVIQETI